MVIGQAICTGGQWDNGLSSPLYSLQLKLASPVNPGSFDSFIIWAVLDEKVLHGLSRPPFFWYDTDFLDRFLELGFFAKLY